MARQRIDVVEVGTRDGLQIEPTILATADKIRLIDAVIAAGVCHVEATSFVSPRAVPQLADAAEVVKGIHRRPDTKIAALAPNPKGAERAADAGVDEMVLVVSSSETHNQMNMNRSIAESLAGFPEVARIARERGVRVHGAMATVFGCPFEGDVPHANIERIVTAYAELGITSLTLGDTTGMGTPLVIRDTVRRIASVAPGMRQVMHLHNTRGVGLANVMVGLELGITDYEAALGGTGGCPFAPGASGNICTEDLVYLLEESGYDTGIDLDALIAAAREMERLLGHPLPGQLMRSGHRLKLHDAHGAKRAVG